MIAKSIKSFIAMVFVLTTTSVGAYNSELSARYEKLFAPVKGGKVGKVLHLIKADVFIEDIKKGKRPMIIDVRTPAEWGVFTAVVPGSMVVPVN